MSEPHDFVLDDTVYRTSLTRRFERRRPYQPPDPRHLTAAIPGVIGNIAVAEQQAVRRGEPILVLEAMKMRNEVLSPRDGTIRTIFVKQGQMVPRGEILLEFEG